MTPQGQTRWIVGLALTLVGGFGTLLLMAFRIGGAVQTNTNTLHALASHVCRVEERLDPPLATYDDCLYDITGVKP